MTKSEGLGVVNRKGKTKQVPDMSRYRKDFPILHQKVYGKPLVYLDNAATTQKPQVVIETLERFYREDNSNIHRGVFCLSERATMAYESARHKVMTLIHAPAEENIVFVRGTTEGINLVAQSYGRTFFKKDDEILITGMEHHSNIVPWQIIASETGAKLRVAPINDNGELIMREFEKLLGPKTKFVSVCHVSNALGTINPVKEIIQKVHRLKIPVLIDGAQAVAHLKVDVQDLDCDFYVFSGHKMFAPTGVGVLYGKKELLEQMPPLSGRR